MGHICDHHKIARDFDVKQTGGIEKLLKAVGPALKTPNRKALGILVDANSDPGNQWEWVSRMLWTNGIPSPPEIDVAGTIIDYDPRLGIWLMPDNESPGELEDFIMRLIPGNDPVWPRAHDYIDEIPEADRKFKDKKVLRAKVHAWLATREAPRKMGTAIRTGDLDAAAPMATSFAGWLHRLFG